VSVVLMLVGSLPASAAPEAAKADLLIVNARVWQVPGPDGRAGPRPDAVAVRGDRIVAVGRTGALRGRLAGPATRIVDAHGHTLLPGLEDAHVHFLGGALALQQVVLDGAPDVPELQRRVRAWADAHRDAPWVLGRGWGYGAFGAEALPHRRWLDEVVPDRPALLEGADGHTSWVNSRALALAGVTRDTPDPPNGVIVRDPATGEPTGALKEAAQRLVSRIVPEPTRAERLAALREAVAAATRLGVVRVRSLGGDFEVLDLLDELRQAGQLTVRFDVDYRVPPPGLTDDARHAIAAARAKYQGDRLAFGGVKLMLDGVIDSKTAAMLEPYANDSATGAMFWKRDDYLRTVAELDADGIPLATHAIGDAAIRTALDAYEAAARANGAWHGTGRRRHSVEHVEDVAASDIARFAALDVTASFQPLHANPEPAWMDAWIANVGPEREQRAWAWRSVLEHGGRLAFGSDFPVVTIDPWAGLQMAVTRQYVDAAGRPRPPGGWIPGERLALDQALAAYTQGVALALNRERDEGAIEPGKLADLVLVDRDLHATPPLALGKTRVTHTIVGGRVVYEAR
jgi:predicted amidohydrolase YtcJ